MEHERQGSGGAASGTDGAHRDRGVSALRAGDEDRSRCAGQLAAAAAAGRLTPGEHEARLALAQRAVSRADLAALLGDLPAAPRPEPVVAPERVPPSGLVTLCGVATAQFVLIVLAFAIGVDLERESTSAAVISLEVWAVGSLSGAAGYLIARPRACARRQDAGR